MKTESYDYNLPREKIAFYPPEKRGGSRLLIVDRKSGEITHGKYPDITNFLTDGDLIVLNNTKVENSRLFFVSESGREHEILLFPKMINRSQEALISSSRKLRKNDVLELRDDNSYKIKLIEKLPDQPLWQVKWIEGSPEKASDKYGHVPLPPYIQRADTEEDKLRYNTTFAVASGSSASPTASLNLTNELINNIKQSGIAVAEVTLHVGWGTFAPIRTEKIEDHNIHREWYEITEETAAMINRTKAAGGKVCAFGTTVTRVLESSYEEDKVKAFSGFTELFIYPGYDWKVIDMLVTNFHAPKTSLLTLVSSFMGYNLMLEAYQSALDNDYKFLSYGDSMLII